jgi:hypothetical protein
MDGTLSCPACDREVDDALTWCPFCGAELRARPAEAHEEAPAHDEQTEALGSEATGDDGAASDGEPDPFSGSAAPVRPADAAGGGTGSPGAKAAVAGLGVLVLLGGLATWFFFIRGGGGDVGVDRMSTGDCWDDPIDIEVAETLTEVATVSCDDPHDNEVFAVVKVTGGGTGGFPGDGVLGAEAFERCLARFEAYVGVPYRESPLEVYPLYPTEASWADGDRQAICSLYMLDLSTMSGSQRDAGVRMSEPGIDLTGVDDCPTLADATIVVVQDFIDLFDSMTEAELDAASDTTPEGMFPLIKSESLLATRADAIGCDPDDLNTLVMYRAGALTYESEFGGYMVDEIMSTGFYATG